MSEPTPSISEHKNLIFAIALTLVVLMGFQLMFPGEEKDEEQSLPQASVQTADDLSQPVHFQRAGIPVQSEKLTGSINLYGAKVDDLKLVSYFQTLDQKDEISLLSDQSTDQPYYIELGWVGSNVRLPDSQTKWSAQTSSLTTKQPLTLTWNNGQGLLFKRVYTIDDHYMLTVTDTVRNTSASSVKLFPYGKIVREVASKKSNAFTLCTRVRLALSTRTWWKRHIKI